MALPLSRMLDFSRRRIRETVGVSVCPEPSPNLSREKQHPHPRRRRGLSRNIAGEASNRSRGTRHPNLGEGPECISRGGGFWVIVALPFLGGACVGGRA